MDEPEAELKPIKYWKTDVPGLVLWKDERFPKKPWRVVHQESGLPVWFGGFRLRGTAKKPEGAYRLAQLLGDLADWTLPQRELVTVPIKVQAIRIVSEYTNTLTREDFEAAAAKKAAA